ncbi:peptidyl-prolyl cis-trans isomerase, FKBP-type domain protein, partial [mine drainage metagenome]
MWAEGGGRTDLIDTTREEVAQKAGAQRGDGAGFAPRPHLIGGEFFPSGIEKGLEGLVPGQEATKTFPPAEAFGERDPKLIELFGMHEIQRLPEMRREDARLDIGTVLTIRGRRGRVVSLTAARVRVDFNPPYAGRTVRGTFKVVSRIDAPAEQARAMIELHYGHGSEFRVEMEGPAL